MNTDYLNQDINNKINKLKIKISTILQVLDKSEDLNYNDTENKNTVKSVISITKQIDNFLIESNSNFNLLDFNFIPNICGKIIDINIST